VRQAQKSGSGAARRITAFYFKKTFHSLTSKNNRNASREILAGGKTWRRSRGQAVKSPQNHFLTEAVSKLKLIAKQL
jgi:hypothetical protein